MEAREVRDVWGPVGVGKVLVVLRAVPVKGTEVWDMEDADEVYED